MKTDIVSGEELTAKSLTVQYYFKDVRLTLKQEDALCLLSSTTLIDLRVAKQLEKKSLVIIQRQWSKKGVDRVIHYWVQLTPKGQRIRKKIQEHRSK